MSVSAVNATTAPTETYQSSASAAQQAEKSSLQSLNQDFDDFLVLLTTQLQNQDPLEPQDSSEFTNQLVQFSQVEQQINSNKKLDTLVQLQDLSLTSIALGYIGMNVQIEGNEFNYKGNGAYEAFYTLPAGGAETVEIKIFDDQGQEITRIPGSAEGGKRSIVWDGKNSEGNPVEAGDYKITVNAFDAEGEPVSTQTSITVQIDGIESIDGQVLLTADDIYIPYGAIQAATLPPEAVEG